jgi:hypothetical protein
MVFRMPIRDQDDAALAVDSLYLPGLDPRRRTTAISALAQRAGSVSLPIPLRRVIATRDAGIPAEPLPGQGADPGITETL